MKAMIRNLHIAQAYNKSELRVRKRWKCERGKDWVPQQFKMAELLARYANDKQA